jgi:hypothetical protein
MLSLPVSILPISSIHPLAPLSSRTITESPACAGLCAHRGAPEGSAVSLCDHHHAGATSPVRALVPWFRIDSVANGPCLNFFAKAASRPWNPPASRPRSPRKDAGTDSHKMKGLSLLECALTQKRGGGCRPVSRPSTSFFVSVEPRCHNGLLRGPRSIYLQTLRQRGRHGQS